MSLEYKTKPSQSGENNALVIFLHGYGADGADLLGLSQPLGQYMPNTVFVAPDAPEPCVGNPFGYQWFPVPWIDGASQEAMLSSIATSSEKLYTFWDEIAQETGVASENTALVGFSQGTMMSLQCGPTRDPGFAAIVGFSGRLMDTELINDAKSKPPIQLIHGDQDEMVDYGSMASAETALKGAGFDVATHTSNGIGHGIAPDGLSVALQFLKANLPNS